jgi:hypothetical protein
MTPARLHPPRIKSGGEPPPLATTDEFWCGVWWVPDEARPGHLRSATPGECVTEIMRLRELVATLEGTKP